MARIIELATRYGRYGYGRITALLKQKGWKVNHKRVERIWPREGLKVPKKQPKRGRLWLNDGSCVRLRAEYKDHIWSYDLMMARTAEGKAFRILNIIDKYTRAVPGIFLPIAGLPLRTLWSNYSIYLYWGGPRGVYSHLIMARNSQQ